METELIAGTGSLARSLDLNDDIPISLNYAIADIKDPSKRNGAFSKTITLPGSDTNNIFFEFIFDVNVSTNYFNPNVKTDCYVLQESIEVFKGYLRLLGIEVILKNDIQEIVYSVAIFGENNDLFGVIGDDKLQDLDFSDLNHVYNRVNQYNSWSASTGDNYVYPLIDYGYNAFLTNSFSVEHFRPAIYVKEYIDRIFSAAGKTYTSSFFNSSFFKSWIIPFNGDKFTMTSSNLALYEFYAGNSGAITSVTKNLTITGSAFNDWWSGDIFNSTSSSYLMKFNDDTTSPFVDTGNIYDPSTGIITIGQTGTYNINFKSDFEIKLSAVPAGTSTINMSVSGFWVISYKVLLSTDGGATWNIIYNNTPNNQSNVITTSYQTINKTWSLPTTSFNTGDKIKLHIHPLYSPSGYGLVFKDVGGNPIYTGTATIDYRFRNTATIKSNLSTGDYVSGQTLSMADAIPKDIKQRDFLKSILQMGNLYVDQDPNDVNNYLIEPRDDYYSSGTTKDWTDKLSTENPMSIRLMTEIDVKNFIYRYKSDTDYFNKKYEDLYNESYGSHKQVVINDFSQRDDITEVIFSPTPVVDNTNNDLIIPKIFSYDGTNVKPQKHNIRILMYNGVQSNTTTWNYVAPSSDVLGAATLAMSTYPASAMVDDPLNPTESIEFGVPNMTFYTLGSNYTTNNIYNSKYSKFINELTDRDSRIVTAYFYLTPDDIALFDFRDKIFVKDTLYFVNKLSDYNKIKPGLTKVELLKIKTASAYTPTQVSVSAIITNSTGTGIPSARFGNSPEDTNNGAGNNVLIGDNNSSRSVGSFVSGSRNSISSGALRVTIISTNNSNIQNDTDSITLIGCSGINVGASGQRINLINCTNVDVNELVYNFTGINLDNETITTSMNGVVKMGLQASEEMQWVTKTSNFTVDPAIQAYKIDRTAGDVTATFDFSTMSNMNFYFKIIDSSSNKFYIDEITGNPLVDGNAIPYDTGAAQWDDIKIGNDGTNFSIL